MNGTDDIDQAAAADEGGLDPREAATLLDQTRRRAQRQFDIRPPLLMLTGAVAVLVAYGSVWLSVRGQHPYQGPTAAGLIGLYSTIAVCVVVVAVIFRRATTGVGGRSSRQRRAQGIAFGTIWASVYVFQGALHHAGASHAIAYGIYPAVAPLLIVGSAAAAYEVAQENFGLAGLAIAAVALAALGAYTGPVSVWGVMGVGLCVLLLSRAAVQVWWGHA
jgi:hypothetical protein